MDTKIINAVIDAGFDVYMRDIADTYLFFTDGKNIGYLQNPGRMDPLTISTVHIPNTLTGTGFGLGEPKDLGRDELSRTFAMFGPGSWTREERESVQKWRDAEHFFSSDNWRRSFKRVEPTAA